MRNRALLLLLAGLAIRPASATVLDFSAQVGGQIPQDYGDRVSAAIMGVYSYGFGFGWTPNVTADYGYFDPLFQFQSLNFNHWGPGYGDLPNVAYGTEGHLNNVLRLTADAGYEVVLNSL